MHGDNFVSASNEAVSSVQFSTPLFVALATERKSEDVMPVRHGGGHSDGTECNTGLPSLLLHNRGAQDINSDITREV